MKDLVSIIIPVYNVEKYFDTCMKSILSQTYDNLEIILVDDGSTDNSGNMCDEYKTKDERIKVIHKENGGLSDARNVALKICKGKYVTLIDSDDYVTEDYIEYLYNLIKDNDADMSICEFNMVWDYGKRINNPLDNGYIKSYNKKEALFELLNNRYYSNSASGKLYKTEHFIDVEYPCGRLFEDLATTYKLFLKCDKVVFGARALYNYIFRKGSIVHQKEFKPNRMDAIEFGEKMCDCIVSLYPDLKRIAKCRMFDLYSLLMLDANTPDSQNVVKEAYNELKKLRFTVIFYPYSRMPRKIKALISLFGSKFLLSVMDKEYN